jgi:hypothetical protein
VEIVEQPTHPKLARSLDRIERVANRFVRSRDRARSAIGLGGRKALYDDASYEFVGGAGERMRKRHYDKSLRLLWKAGTHAPYLDFKDCSPAEKALFEQAVEGMNAEEKGLVEQLSLPEFKSRLNAAYTPKQKQAIVNVLSSIGHGEAYAWLVSAELLGEVKSTGARAAFTMQVLEEAKHFIVLRELLRAFDVPIPRQSAWDYLFLEGVYKAKGLDKAYGMNVVVESFALNLFGKFGEWPCMELLKLFHLDESRHSALPHSYFSDFPMTAWQKNNPVARVRRLKMVLPALALIVHHEEDLAVLGIDAFDLGGSILRKVTSLGDRCGFHLAIPRKALLSLLDEAFNQYRFLTREDHVRKSYTEAPEAAAAA